MPLGSPKRSISKLNCCIEQRMIAAAPIVLEATAEVPDDAGDVEDSPPDAPA